MECVKALSSQPFEVVIVQPNDENYRELGVRTLTLSKEYSGVGAGAPRFVAGQLAMAEGDDAMIFVDDDVIVNPDKSNLADLIDSLEKAPMLGTVACSYAGYYKLHEDYPWLQIMPSFGVAYAVRMSAHNEIGGFDEQLVRLEDMDFAYRLRVAGYWIGADTRVRIGHKNYMEGGMKAFETGDLDITVDREEAKEIAAENRTRMAQIVMRKYPPNSMIVDKRGWPRFKRGALEGLKEVYQEGLLQMTRHVVR